MIPVLVLVLLLLLVGFILRRRRARRQRAARTRQFYAWVDQSPALDPELRQWFTRMPAPDAATVVARLSRHCAELNWELTWLFSPHFSQAPVLKDAVETTVAAYLQAVFTGQEMVDDVKAYHAYTAFVRKPMARRRRALVQALYTQMQKDGLVAPAVSSVQRLRDKLPGARKREKAPSRKEQVAAIQRAFDADPARAMAALKQVLTAANNDTQSQPKKPATPASGVTVAAASAAGD